MTPPTDPSYTAQALRTESPITPALQTRLQQQARLVHAVLGLQTEAGELADPVKKHIYYGRPLDPVNLREEIGDCLWYLAIACDALGTTLEAEQARNLAKLRARYPHVFTAEAAQVRDLDRERQVLESDTAPASPCAECARKQHQLDAAQVTILAQRAGIERLQKCVGKVRSIMDREYDGLEFEHISGALVELDGEPAPATEPAPCPECERLEAELETANEHRTDLVLFVDKVRKCFRVWGSDDTFIHSVSHALSELDKSNPSATLTSSPTPVADTAEGGQ